MPDSPRCAQCRTYAVANDGDKCSDCAKKTQEQTDRLIADLKKPKK